LGLRRALWISPKNKFAADVPGMEIGVFRLIKIFSHMPQKPCWARVSRIGTRKILMSKIEFAKYQEQAT
jgi:hypothetical protein